MLPVNYRSWQRSFLKLPILSIVKVDIPVERSFQRYQIPTTLRTDVPVAIRATKSLEDTMLPVNYQSWNVAFQSYQSWQQWELTFLSTIAFRATKCSQQWKLTFLSTVAFRTTKFPTTLRADVPVAVRATKNLFFFYSLFYVDSHSLQ